jgi:hypothetical protein
MPELLPVDTTQTSAIEIHQSNLVAVVDVQPPFFCAAAVFCRLSCSNGFMHVKRLDRCNFVSSICTLLMPNERG